MARKQYGQKEGLGNPASELRSGSVHVFDAGPGGCRIALWADVQIAKLLAQ